MGYSLGWKKPTDLTFDPNFRRDIQSWEPLIIENKALKGPPFLLNRTNVESSMLENID